MIKWWVCSLFDIHVHAEVERPSPSVQVFNILRTAHKHKRAKKTPSCIYLPAASIKLLLSLNLAVAQQGTIYIVSWETAPCRVLFCGKGERRKGWKSL